MRFFICSLFIYVLGQNLYAQPIDSLVAQLNEKTGEERTPILHELILSVWLNYPDQAKVYADEALKLSTDSSDSTNISKSLRLIAGVYYYKGDYDQSLNYNLKALDIAQSLKDSSLINNGFNNLGLLFFELGSYQTALEYLLKSKEMKEQMSEIYGMATTLNNIGRVFNQVELLDSARTYFLKAYEVALLDDEQNEIYSLNNLGNTYLKEGAYQVSLDYYQRAHARADELGNIFWGSESLRGMGEVFMAQREYDTARFFLIQSLQSSKHIDNKKGIAEAYYSLARLTSRVGSHTQALAYLAQSDTLAMRIKQRQQLLDNLKERIEIYKRQNKKDQVIREQTQFIHLQDSLFKDVAARNLALIPIKLREYSERRELAEKEEQLRNKSLTSRFYASALLISIPLLIILIVLLKKNQRTHRELLTYNEELQQTQKLLITSEKMASLGVMAAGIAHEINNPLNFIKNGTEALALSIKTQDKAQKKELEELFKIIEEGVSRASKIVKSLSHFSRKGPDMDEQCNVKDIIENCLLILHNKIKNKVQVLTDFSDSSLIVVGNEGRLHQVMMNIIANAVQAIKITGTLKISTLKRGYFLDVVIEDDGEGIPQAHLSKISDPFFTTKEPGEGTGLGLFITYSIVEEHNGYIDVISTPGEGTIFTISLPLNEVAVDALT